MNNVIFPTKLLTEERFLSVDFANQLDSGETLTSFVVTATTYIGTDATPSNIISGSATASGSVVTQKIVGGVAGVIYLLRYACATNQGNNKVVYGKLATLTSREL